MENNNPSKRSSRSAHRERALTGSEIMRRVHSSNTAPEMRLRRALWAAGLRYRIGAKGLPGKPDIIFPARKVAVFVDGDFWHGRQWKQRGLTGLSDQFKKTASRRYWIEKILRNTQRDCEVTTKLLRAGWTVLRFWEKQVNDDLEGCVEMATAVVREECATYDTGVPAEKTFAEFFAGIGLMRMGLQRAGWSIRFANDIDETKYAMYRGHFQGTDEDFFLGDVHKLDASRVPTVALATASFPCNDLSLAGARAGLLGKQSSAFWGFIRVLEQMGERRPPLVMLENVIGFLTSHNGQDFSDAMKALNQLGYKVDPFIIDAARFVPQSRQRMFIIGTRELPSTVRESLQFFESALRPHALSTFIFEHPEIDWTIRDLPELPVRETLIEDILEKLPEDALEWWVQSRADYLLAQMSPRHRAIADSMIVDNKVSYGTVFRRVRSAGSMAELRTDGVAGCLRTPRGGSGRQILFVAGLGNFRVRLLTPRECARLMGADDFRINAPLNQALFGFGDAVCVPVIQWIAESYLNPWIMERLRGRPLLAAS